MSGSDMLILGVVAVLVVLIAVRYIKAVCVRADAAADATTVARGACALRRRRSPIVTRCTIPMCSNLVVGGMSCAGCVANVENALNAQPGTWATAQLSGDVRVRGKEPLDADACEAAIKAAGYYVKKL